MPQDSDSNSEFGGSFDVEVGDQRRPDGPAMEAPRTAQAGRRSALRLALPVAAVVVIGVPVVAGIAFSGGGSDGGAAAPTIGPTTTDSSPLPPNQCQAEIQASNDPADLSPDCRDILERFCRRQLQLGEDPAALPAICRNAID